MSNYKTITFITLLNQIGCDDCVSGIQDANDEAAKQEMPQHMLRKNEWQNPSQIYCPGAEVIHAPGVLDMIVYAVQEFFPAIQEMAAS